MINIHLVGKKWKTDGTDSLDGFKIISVDLELAEWKDNDQLYDYITSTYFGDFPLWGDRLHEEQLTEIIEILKNEPSKIYGENLKQAAEDLTTFMKVKEWLVNNVPHASVEFDIV